MYMKQANLFWQRSSQCQLRNYREDLSINQYVFEQKHTGALISSQHAIQQTQHDKNMYCSCIVWSMRNPVSLNYPHLSRYPTDIAMYITPGQNQVGIFIYMYITTLLGSKRGSFASVTFCPQNFPIMSYLKFTKVKSHESVNLQLYQQHC